MWRFVIRWYEGKYQVFYNSPDSPVVFVGGRYKRHWTANVAHALVEFWFREWKWIIGTSIAIGGLLIALKRLG